LREYRIPFLSYTLKAWIQTRVRALRVFLKETVLFSRQVQVIMKHQGDERMNIKENRPI